MNITFEINILKRNKTTTLFKWKIHALQKISVNFTIK